MHWQKVLRSKGQTGYTRLTISQSASSVHLENDVPLIVKVGHIRLDGFDDPQDLDLVRLELGDLRVEGRVSGISLERGPQRLDGLQEGIPLVDFQILHHLSDRGAGRRAR